MFRRRPSMPNPSTADPQLIFHKFLEFLETDMWLLPITNFMEQNSIAFEREQGDPNTFVKIYKKFTDLVDRLIDSYCQDTGVKGQDLVEALKSTDKGSKLSYKEKVLLEPIVAAQDFNIFVPMMMRKNIELQLQALKMLEHLSGLLPSSLKLDEDDAELWKVLFDEDESERLILISVLKQSREEFEHDQRIRDEWQKQLDAATQNSLREKELLESMRKMEQNRLDEAMKMADEKFKNMSIGGGERRIFTNLVLNNYPNEAVVPAPSTSKHQIPEVKASNSTVSKNVEPSSRSNEGEKQNTENTGGPNSSSAKATTKSSGDEQNKAVKTNLTSKNSSQEKREKEKTGDQEMAATQQAQRKRSLGKVKHHVNQLQALLKDKEQIPEEMVRQRAEYLKEQRDKLLGMKKKQREIQLIESSKKTASERPRTAKVARGALGMSNTAEKETLESLKTRRTIAAKIKSDVMNLPI